MKLEERKMARAKKEMLLLKERLIAWSEAPEHRIMLEAVTDGSTLKHRIYLTSVPDYTEPQEEICVSVGVIANLLRSSLDNLVFDLAMAYSGGSISQPHKIQFPIDTEEERFQQSQERCLKEVDPKHVKIIESYQPYKGRNGRNEWWHGTYVHPLERLKLLSNEDKHRIPVRVVATPGGTTLIGAGAKVHSSWSARNRAIVLNSNPQHDEEQLANGPWKADLRSGTTLYAVHDPSYTITSPQSAGYVIPYFCHGSGFTIVEELHRIATLLELIFADLRG